MIGHPYLYELIKTSVLDRHNIIRGGNLDSVYELRAVFVTILERPGLGVMIVR
jgi:hypothetical protein